MTWFFAYLALGILSGFFAGMLGIGGGLVMVPVLTMFFAWQGFAAAQVLHLALGTSMAVIVFTSISSLRTHHRHGAVRWDIVKILTPGILLGTTLGTTLVSRIPTRPLAIFFTLFVCVIALQMIAKIKPTAARTLPGTTGMLSVGTVIGVVSSLVAIGGGSLTVPFLTWCSIRIQQAIGTSAAVGFPIALSGTIGYIYNGWQAPELPVGTLGYVYLPALAGIAIASIVTAPYGAKTAHRLPVPILQRIFAVMLIVLAGKMLWNLFNP